MQQTLPFPSHVMTTALNCFQDHDGIAVNIVEEQGICQAMCFSELVRVFLAMEQNSEKCLQHRQSTMAAGCVVQEPCKMGPQENHGADNQLKNAES